MHTSIFAWVDTAQKYNNSIHALTRNDNISVDQDMQKLTKQPVKGYVYCYYCGKTGHHFKTKTGFGLVLTDWQTNLHAKLTLTTKRNTGITSMKLQHKQTLQKKQLTQLLRQFLTQATDLLLLLWMFPSEELMVGLVMSKPF